MADTELMSLYKTARNPIEESRFQQLLKEQGLNASDIGSGGNGADASVLSPNGSLMQTNQALSSAKRIRDFTRESNQPAIQSYEASKQPLKDRYKSVLDQIKGNQIQAETRQTTATNNEFARRGISNNSGIYEQGMADAVNPITQQYTGKYGEVAAQEGQDLAAIQNAIAMLQSGNPAESIGAALNIGSQGQQAQQFEQNMSFQRAMQEAANALKAKELEGGSNPYVTLSEGQTLFNLLNGQPVYTNPKTYKPTGGGGGNDPLGLL